MSWKCSKCGNHNVDDITNCLKCGSTNVPQSPQQKRIKDIIFLIAIVAFFVLIFQIYYLPGIRKKAALANPEFTNDGINRVLTTILGGVNRDGVNSVSSITIVPNTSTPGMSNLLIVLPGPDNLSDDMILNSACERIGKTAQTIRDAYKQVGFLQITVTFPMKDSYGNVTEKPIVEARYTRETLNKTDFNNLYGADVLKPADGSWVHPSMSQ